MPVKHLKNALKNVVMHLKFYISMLLKWFTLNKKHNKKPIK